LKPTAVVFYPAQTPEETAIISAKVKLESADENHFAITLDDGKVIAVDLDKLTVGVRTSN
jgi:hypothetical protein